MTTVTHGDHAPCRHRLAWIVGLLGLVLGLVLGAVAVSTFGNDGSATSTAVIVGSGTAAKETRSVQPFTAVDLAGSNEVNVRVGDEQTVVVRGDDNILPHVTTDVRSETLVIGADRSFQTKTPLTVDVTVPALTAARLAGSGQVNVLGVGAATFEATLPGSGTLRASGAAEMLDAELSGSGQLKLDHLVATDVKAVVSGAGQLRVHATRTLDARVSGVGQIVYTGSPPNVTQQVTGAGTVTPG